MSVEQISEIPVVVDMPDRPNRGEALSVAVRQALHIPDRALGWIVPLSGLLLWEFLARIGVLPPNGMPAPSVIASTIADLARSGELWQHIGITLLRIALGFTLGASAGIVLAALTGSFPLLRKLLDPFVQSLRNIPSMAWVPLFLLWLGIQESSKIGLIALGAFFPMYLNLLSGILNVDRKLVEVGLIYRLSGFQLIRRVILPAAFPAFLVGLRSGLGLAWMFVVAAEIMGASKGLGFLMVDGQQTGRASIILASVILFAVFGKATDAIVQLLSKRWLKNRAEEA
jgi:sulfonate transport system permease protein